MHRRYTQELAGFASPVSKALVNSGSSRLVKIASIKMVKEVCHSGFALTARPGMTSRTADCLAEGGLRRG
jgi:hypothetical protein